MKKMMKKRSHLQTVTCLMLVLVMLAGIFAEPAQAAVYTPGLTTDMAEREPAAKFWSYGRAGKGGAGILNTALTIPEGDAVYMMYERNACNGMTIYSVFWKGRMWQVNAKNIVDIKATKYMSTCTEKTRRENKTGKKVEAKKIALIGKVEDPLQTYFIYAEPKVSDDNVVAEYAAGGSIKVIEPNYNSEWAEVLFNENAIGYMKKSWLNYKDAYLAGASVSAQPYIKLAKKKGFAQGVLKQFDYEGWITKKEFCRLAVNWYKATGHKLPEQSTKSPFTDTDDSYVIMAYQLGIVKSTKDNKFNPKKTLMHDQYNAMVKRLLKVSGESSSLYEILNADMLGSYYSYKGITREKVLQGFSHAYLMCGDTDYLVNDFGSETVIYTISPADNKKVCLDVYEGQTERGAKIGLWEKNGDKNQKFYIKEINGFKLLCNKNSKKALTGTGNDVYQEAYGYECQKLSFQYNKDGTVCIINGNGKYLEVKDGNATNGGDLIWAAKNGSSTQKWVFTWEVYHSR